MLDLSREVDFGCLLVRPGERSIIGPSGTVAVEPLVMRLLLALSRRAGRMVDRAALFQLCWGDTPVGDDSLNRIVASLRRALRVSGGDTVQIETVPAAGYVLRLSHDVFPETFASEEIGHARRAARTSWRLAFPEPDCLTIERLRRAVALRADDAEAWGLLALMYRHAAEYAAEHERADHVAHCEQAARRALDIAPDQPEAQVALVSVAPLFGYWDIAYERLSAICAAHPENVIAAHDLSIVEMSTGRVRAAMDIINRLISTDQVAAIYGYKSTYHHWSVGDLDMMDRRGDSAIQLWPTHPAVWTARFWTFAYTGRHKAAMSMLEDAAPRPAMPPPLFSYLRALLQAVEEGQASALETCAQRALQAATSGPAQAITSLFALGLIDDSERAQTLLRAYYLHDGGAPVPNNVATEAPVNEMRRRLTQILFTPAGSHVRSAAAFDELCHRTGLERYWATTGRTPDFRR